MNVAVSDIKYKALLELSEQYRTSVEQRLACLRLASYDEDPSDVADQIVHWEAILSGIVRVMSLT